jgi:hypothetical protein
MMWKAGCDHTLPSPVPFHGPPPTRNTVTSWSPSQVARGEPCGGPPMHSLTGPLGQPFASCLGGPMVCVPGMHNTQYRTGFLLVALSHYTRALFTLQSVSPFFFRRLSQCLKQHCKSSPFHNRRCYLNTANNLIVWDLNIPIILIIL